MAHSFINMKLYNIVLFFFIYSLLGWITEVIYSYYKHKKFVNRGFLYGTFCPIYGFGVVLITLLSYPFKDNLLSLYVFTVVITSLLEYVTAYVLEKSFNSRWWDYSKNKFNLKGRICLSFSLIWGVAGVFILEIIHPVIINLLGYISENTKILLSYGIITYFLIDSILTLKSLINLNVAINRLMKLEEEFKTILTSKELEFINERFNKLNDKFTHNHKRLLKNFPIYESNRFKAIHKMKSNINEKFKHYKK